MDTIELPTQPTATKRKPANRRQTLLIRLHFQRHLTELVQLLGYRDVPLDEIAPRLAALDERYGRDIMDAAKEELMEIVTVSQTAARLRSEVHQLARQILGAPPQETRSSQSQVPETRPSVSSPPSAVAAAQFDGSPPAPPHDAPPEREPLPTGEERYLAAYEAHEGTLYCCDRPNLKWSGEIEDLSVACESCGYVLFARDELMPDGEPPGILLDVASDDAES
jgi:hypothetical protein